MRVGVESHRYSGVSEQLLAPFWDARRDRVAAWRTCTGGSEPSSYSCSCQTGQKSYIPNPHTGLRYPITELDGNCESLVLRDKEENVQKDQTVSEMAREVLIRQAEILARQTGQSVEEALEATIETAAGRQLRDLRDGTHCDEKARAWQESLPQERARERQLHSGASYTLPCTEEEPRYSGVEGYLEWLEGREAREEYRVFFEQRPLQAR